MSRKTATVIKALGVAFAAPRFTDEEVRGLAKVSVEQLNKIDAIEERPEEAYKAILLGLRVMEWTFSEHEDSISAVGYLDHGGFQLEVSVYEHHDEDGYWATVSLYRLWPVDGEEEDDQTIIDTNDLKGKLRTSWEEFAVNVVNHGRCVDAQAKIRDAYRTFRIYGGSRSSVDGTIGEIDNIFARAGAMPDTRYLAPEAYRSATVEAQEPEEVPPTAEELLSRVYAREKRWNYVKKPWMRLVDAGSAKTTRPLIERPAQALVLTVSEGEKMFERGDLICVSANIENRPDEVRVDILGFADMNHDPENPDAPLVLLDYHGHPIDLHSVCYPSPLPLTMRHASGKVMGKFQEHGGGEGWTETEWPFGMNLLTIRRKEMERKHHREVGRLTLSGPLTAAPDVAESATRPSYESRSAFVELSESPCLVGEGMRFIRARGGDVSPLSFIRQHLKEFSWQIPEGGVVERLVGSVCTDAGTIEVQVGKGDGDGWTSIKVSSPSNAFTSVFEGKDTHALVLFGELSAGQGEAS